MSIQRKMVAQVPKRQPDEILEKNAKIGELLNMHTALWIIINIM